MQPKLLLWKYLQLDLVGESARDRSGVNATDSHENDGQSTLFVNVLTDGRRYGLVGGPEVVGQSERGTCGPETDHEPARS